MTPLVSVVIPAHNKGQTLVPAVESVLRQTVRDLEVIVVDDGSMDDTAQQAHRLEQRIRYFYQPQAGVSVARNRGIQEARGQFVAFLDGDDLWLPQKLELQLARLEREPAVDAVQCSAYLVNNALQVVDARQCHPAQDTLLDFLLFRNLPGFGSTLLARKRRLEALGGYGADLVILEDWDLACRLARQNTLRSLADFLVLYRQHPGNRSRNVTIHVEPGFRSLDRLFADATLDPVIRRESARIWARFFAMLAGGYAQNRQWRECLYWAGRALRTAPSISRYIAGMPLRRLQRVVAARHQISFAEELAFASAPTFP